MAITFEEKNSTGKMVASALIILILLGAAGFFAWKYLMSETVSPAVDQSDKEKIDEKALTDARINELELFPEVPPSSVPAGKLNPFSESTTTLEVEPAEAVVSPAGE